MRIQIVLFIMETLGQMLVALLQDVIPIIGGYSVGKEEEARREKESMQPVLTAELLLYVVKMTRQTFF